MTEPPTAAECTTEAEATTGMGTAARMTRVRTAAKNAFTEPHQWHLRSKDKEGVQKILCFRFSGTNFLNVRNMTPI